MVIQSCRNTTQSNPTLGCQHASSAAWLPNLNDDCLNDVDLSYGPPNLSPTNATGASPRPNTRKTGVQLVTYSDLVTWSTTNCMYYTYTPMVPALRILAGDWSARPRRLATASYTTPSQTRERGVRRPDLPSHTRTSGIGTPRRDPVRTDRSFELH